MKTILENERITVEYDDYDEIYRISFFDINCHYESEIIIDKGQFEALNELLNNK